MRRFAAVVTFVILSSTTLAGCGGSAYCDAVEADQETLNSFGEERTNAAYANYASVLNDIAAGSPDEIKDDWTTLAEVTENVIETHDSVGLALEEIEDTEELAQVGEEDLAQLNEAYVSFNDTADERAEVVNNVKQECQITLE